jgi:hypothetical protein
MSDGRFDEPHCDNSGRCVALESDRKQGVSQCRFCGKQLELHGDLWFTWDARFLPPDQRRPQDEESAPRA